jgi:hypothetical protein
VLIFPHFTAWTARTRKEDEMTKLSDIRDNLKNSPPRLLKVVDELLEWCNPALRDLSRGSKGRDPIMLRLELMERGLYPYQPGSRPVDILGDGITPRGPYQELGFIVDDYLVGVLTGDVYENILRLIEREGAPFLPARGDEESIRDFLLRMRSWCLRVRRNHSEVGHSADFHSVRWHGQDFTFSHQQAAVVRLLWTAHENGTPDLSQETLLDKSGSSGGRLRDVFKEANGTHPAWSTMIVESRKGVFRLSEPEKKS